MREIPLGLLHDFMHGFYGYGEYAAKHWFIGIEEKGGRDEDEICRRLEAWDRRNREPLEDLLDFHSAIGASEVFHRKKPQKTWKGLIELLFALEGREASDEAVLAGQETLGRHGGSTCLMELLPLPSPNSSDWHYRDFRYDAQKPNYLSSRGKCRKHCAEKRALNIRDKLVESEPDLVVFYGRARRKNFQKLRAIIVSEHLDLEQPSHIGKTCFLLLRHPADGRNALPKDYFVKWGRRLAECLPRLG